MTSSLLITNCKILTLNKKRELVYPGAILIEEKQIRQIGDSRELENKYPLIEKLDVQGKLVMPGLINSHVHAAHILLRGGPSQDKNHLDWLVNVLYPAIYNYNEETVRTAYSLFSIEAISRGVTTIVDNVCWGNRKDLSTSAIETLLNTGMRAIHAKVFSDCSSTEQEDLVKLIQRKGNRKSEFSFEVEPLEKTLIFIENLINTYHTRNQDLIRIWPAPGSPLSVSPEAIRGAFSLAEKYDTMVTVHLAETQSTSSYKDMSITKYLEIIGGINSRLLAAHCVWMNDHDLRILKHYDAKVVNNVVSNMFLGSGIAPISKMIDLGITVGLGTDDMNCNNSTNMFSDMKICALAQKVNQLDASAITAEKVLEMATIEGAKAIGMSEKIGSLEPDKHADLIVLDLDQPHLTPCFHIPSTLVYQANGSEIESVMVDGKWLMKNKTIQFIDPQDLSKIINESQETAQRILENSEMGHLMHRGWKSTVT